MNLKKKIFLIIKYWGEMFSIEDKPQTQMLTCHTAVSRFGTWLWLLLTQTPGGSRMVQIMGSCYPFGRPEFSSSHRPSHCRHLDSKSADGKAVSYFFFNMIKYFGETQFYLNASQPMCMHFAFKISCTIQF